MNKRGVAGLAMIVCGLWAHCGHSAMLDPYRWDPRDANNTPIPQIVDGQTETIWISETPQREGMFITVNFGVPLTLHRLYLTTGKKRSWYPRGLALSIGDSTNSLRQFLDVQLPREVETHLKFEPVTGRMLRMSISGDGAGYPWALSEMLLFGWDSDRSAEDCVVVDEKAPELVRRAADDLQHYVSELISRPVAMVTPEEAHAYTGLHLRVASPPEFETYEEWLKSPEGRSPEEIHVSRHGREIRFEAPTQRAVWYSVCEFLHRNGVRWLHPSALGDFVPAGKGLDLSMLPIKDRPDFSRRHANWNSARDDTDRESYWWYYRNRWNESWMGRLNRRPGRPEPKRSPGVGYTHTFARVVDGSLFDSHPEWFPLLKNPRWAGRIGLSQLGRRIPYSATWGLNFCTSNTNVINHTVQTILDNTQPYNVRETVWLTPMDAAVFCECKACTAQDDPDQKHTGPWRETISKTPRYLTYVTTIADRIRTQAPALTIGTFAYEGYIDPPAHLEQLPANVFTDVIQYGVYSLPLSAPENSWMKGIMQNWAALWKEPGNLGVYDWSLLLHNVERMPVPLVTALSDRMRTWHRLGARRVGTQANARPRAWEGNPWNFYAYGRLAWHAEEDPDEIIRDFFMGYYREAGESMYRYYSTLETHFLVHSVTLKHDLKYIPTDSMFPPGLLDTMRVHLGSAARQAKHWLIRRRVSDASAGFQEILESLR